MSPSPHPLRVGATPYVQRGKRHQFEANGNRGIFTKIVVTVGPSVKGLCTAYLISDSRLLGEMKWYNFHIFQSWALTKHDAIMNAFSTLSTGQVRFFMGTPIAPCDPTSSNPDMSYQKFYGR
jgi:hypothetical protein